MLGIIAKATVGIALIKTAEHLDRRDVEYKHLKGDRKLIVAFASVIVGGSLVGAAIGDTVVKIVGSLVEE